MSYNFQSYTTGSTSYDLFAPGKTTSTATGSSVNASAQQVTLTFASAPTVNPNDIIFVTGGTFTGNSWQGFRYVVSGNATSVTFAMPNAPGTYVSGVVSMLTPYQEFGLDQTNGNLLFTTNSAGYLNVINNYGNSMYVAPANDNGSYFVPANVAVTLPFKGPALLQFKGASGAVLSAVELP